MIDHVLDYAIGARVFGGNTLSAFFRVQRSIHTGPRTEDIKRFCLPEGAGLTIDQTKEMSKK
jgi:hypothetical protein